ncbi:MAG: flagellar basal-body rod protein FlgF [Alphaproteobacteria bacterium]|nr:MAG: flagellar basal-body rod protein FlgF [Alphaproteobacteria bacterium]
MDTTLYVTLSHQMAMRRYMDLIANNVANMNTTAYRREKVMFHEYLSRMTGTENPAAAEVAYVQDYGVRRDFSQGPLVATSNPLDVAISGEGFFAVERAGSGRIDYTRNGHMRISSDGFLATETGEKVLDMSDNPIAIGTLDSNILIAADGTVSSRQGVLGRLKVVRFADPQSLQKVGQGLYRTDAAPLPADNYTLQRGMLEMSNVNPILEMTDMINVMRSYQSVARLTEQYQELRNQGIQQLGRVQ